MPEYPLDPPMQHHMLHAANLRAFLFEHSILNRAANIYLDVKYICIHSQVMSTKLILVHCPPPFKICSMLKYYIYVTGSGKRDIFTQTMIFQYKRCCSKKRNIIYYSKNIFFGLTVSAILCLNSHQI